MNTDGEANNFFGQRVVFICDAQFSIPHRLTASLVKNQTVADVRRMTLLCDDRTPPLPCAIAVSASFTWRTPHSPRNCRTASISRNRPYMPGGQRERPLPLVF